MTNRAISISLRTFFADIPHNIRVFSFCDLLGNFARGMVLPYASLYILALGGNTAQIGLINSLIPLMGLVILPIAGYLAGRTNRVRLIILSNTMLIINVLIMAFAPTWQVYAVATALMGLAAFQFPARSSLVADSMQPGQRGKGFATLNTISNSLAIVAPFIAGSVITLYGDLRGMRLLLISMAALYGTATLITTGSCAISTCCRRQKTMLGTIPSASGRLPVSSRRPTRRSRARYAHCQRR